ncbi:short-chain dehydrogenase/reductase SDR [Dactylonectria estremocensis]|uniref:Short-chain dehydrogenase/reductase SDR n=1 Tax=Dactylonectria estremocensis TaxID=1079267 RepID=A0A9P9IY35_9HYPO|nr:short-chain dehydrogenase/reductase SDR [Dactylonectria estremocensis]
MIHLGKPLIRAHNLHDFADKHARIDGQVVLITGGGQGIGRATANLLASKGAKIVIADVSDEKANEAVHELRSAGHEAVAFVGDALEDGFAEKAVKASLDAFGSVNCLINGAGFCYDAAIHKMDDEKFDIIMKIHNYVPFRMVRALSSHWMDPENREMVKTVINISSTSGLHGQMGQINYATAKMGIVGLTKTVAAEWARYGVRCNAVAYGWMDTRLTRPPTGEDTVTTAGKQIVTGISASARKFRDTSEIPLGRAGTVDDAAGVMLFLASPLSAYVTATCIECTGGRYM